MSMKKVCGLIIYFTIPVFLITGCITNYNSLGVRLFKQGRILDAYEAFEKGYNLYPESAFSLNNMGYVYEMRDKDYARAMEFYRKALKMCSKERVEQSTDHRMGHKPLEKLIKENIKRVWIKTIAKEENELHVYIIGE